VFVAAVLCLAEIACGSTVHALKAADQRYVVAHWLVPMWYDSESEIINYTALIVDDINALMEAGIDGLTYDCFGSSTQLDYCGAVVNGWSQIADAMRATNFQVFISFDMSGSNATHPPTNLPAEALVASMLAIVNNTHYFKVDGKPVLTTYSGQVLGNSWWNESVIQPLLKAGMAIQFVPNFDRNNTNGGSDSIATYRRVVAEFPSIQGAFNWLAPAAPPFYPSDSGNIGENYWYSLLDYNSNYATALSEAGKFYLWPVMPTNYDECHSARQYTETKGGLGLASQWEAIMGNLSLAPVVYLLTWNDYTEGTFFSPTTFDPLPTQAHGGQTLQHIGYYELQKYFIFWFKNQFRPFITRDAVFFFHRLQPVAANASNDTCPIHQPGPPGKGSQIWGDIGDEIYITTALTSPATLLVISGGYSSSYSVPAGLSTISAPFYPGTQEILLRREGTTVLEVFSAAITANPKTYNYNVFSGYYVDGGDNSDSWQPGSRWQSGFTASWFSSSPPSNSTTVASAASRRSPLKFC